MIKNKHVTEILPSAKQNVVDMIRATINLGMGDQGFV